PLEWPEPLDKVAGDIHAFIDPGLRHQTADDNAIDEMGEHSPWLRQALGYYRALARNGGHDVLEQLDALREQFDAADALFTPALRGGAESPAIERRHARVEQERADQQNTDVSTSQPLHAERAGELAALQSTLAANETNLAWLARQLVRAEAQLG